MTEALEEAKKILRKEREAYLATAGENGPFASAAGYICEESGALCEVILLLSDLARHTRNMKKNASVSLLVVESSSLPIHERKRLTVSGRVVPVQDPSRCEFLKQKYLQRFPRSDIFFTLPDFRFYAVEPDEIYWIGGFGRAVEFVREGTAWKEKPVKPEKAKNA